MYEVFKRDKLRPAYDGPFNAAAWGELGGSACGERLYGCQTVNAAMIEEKFNQEKQHA